MNSLKIPCYRFCQENGNKGIRSRIRCVRLSPIVGSVESLAVAASSLPGEPVALSSESFMTDLSVTRSEKILIGSVGRKLAGPKTHTASKTETV